MEYLINYPYGCVEQTTSRFVPLVLALENPSYFSDALKDKNTDEMIMDGINRLKNLQNDDGGWAWWSSDDSDFFVSVYVAEYLMRAKALGFAVDQNVINKMVSFFEKDYIGENGSLSQEQGDILVLFGRSILGIEKGKREISNFSDDIPVDILSLGLITNVKNNFLDPSMNVRDVLKNRIKEQGNVLFWPSGIGSFSRFGSSSNHAASGLALRAFLEAGGDKEIASGVVRYLLQTRGNSYWSNTFATAQVLQALVGFSSLEKEQGGFINYKVMIDNQEFLSDSFDGTKKSNSINIPIDIIKRDGSNIVVETEGAGQIYSNILIKEFRTNRDETKVSKGIEIEREYLNEKGSDYNIGVGDTVIVKLKVTNLPTNSKYIVIEDQLPSGLVPLNENFKSNYASGSYYYSHKEYTKNGVILSLANPGIGSKAYSYKARVVSEGEFQAPPASATLMYQPEIYGNSGSSSLKVVKKSSQNESISDKIIGSKMGESGAAIIAFFLFLLLSIATFLFYRRIIQNKHDSY